MSKDGDRIRELIEVERDLKSAPRKKEMVVTIQLQPIEFNVFIAERRSLLLLFNSCLSA